MLKFSRRRLGSVARDTENYTRYVQDRERHECDLSASYNIGSRYFLWEYEKSIPGNGMAMHFGKFRSAPIGSLAP